jgi:hypothetical protein
MHFYIIVFIAVAVLIGAGYCWAVALLPVVGAVYCVGGVNVASGRGSHAKHNGMVSAQGVNIASM